MRRPADDRPNSVYCASRSRTPASALHAEDQERIFKPFEQVAEAGRQKGTGLGLAITRQLVELMGGTIEVESTPGKGSCFRVEIAGGTGGGVRREAGSTA